MDMEAIHDEEVIPTLEFSSEFLVSNQGSEEWKAMRNEVREACESYGCFLLLVREETIPINLREEMVMAMKGLFDLPEETKQKHKSTNSFRDYQGKSPNFPLSESFGIDSADQIDAAQAFTNLMWPQGNPAFCEIMKSMSSKLMDLNFTIVKMIFESFGIEKHYKSHEESTTCLLRLMKYYKVPISTQSDDKNAASSAVVGQSPHTDKSFITVLYQINQVQGLEILTKQGNWVQVTIPKGAVVVFVGDAFKVWSNGRLHASRHRVIMSSSSTVDNKSEDRYSCALFGLPEEESMIQPQNELVDMEHPLLYRPFNLAGFFKYITTNIYALSDNPLRDYAGIELVLHN